MRESDSDSGGGWQQPPEYVNPWVPRDEGGAARAPGPAANAAPPPENDVQDTIAFGRPAGQDNGYGQGTYGQPRQPIDQSQNLVGAGGVHNS